MLNKNSVISAFSFTPTKPAKLMYFNSLIVHGEAKGEIDDEEWIRETQRLKTLRDQLNKFVRQLHCKRQNGLTAYTAIGLITAGRDLPKLGLSWPSGMFTQQRNYLHLETCR
jgi:hypothetical protein